MYDDNRLASFLVDRAPFETARWILEVLGPFFKIAETGIYPLDKPSKVRQDFAKSLLGVVLGGAQVEKLVFLSRSNPFPKPEWMNESDWKHAINAALDSSCFLEQSPRCRLHEKFGSLYDILKSDEVGELYFATGYRNEDSKTLLARIYSALCDELKIGIRAYEDVALSILYFIVLTISNHGAAGQLAGLVGLMKSCIPFYEVESGKWVVIVE